MSQEEERRAMLERKRNLLLLIARYLEDHGMSNTVECLVKECGPLSINEYALCDNIDLDTIYLDYMSYYRVKFGRAPNIAKRQEAGKMEHLRAAKLVVKRSRMRSMGGSSEKNKTTEEEVLMHQEKPLLTANFNDSLIVSQCLKQKEMNDELGGDFCRIRPSLKSYCNYSPEWGELASIICRDIMIQTSKSARITWDKIKGLDNVQDMLMESVITPIKYPKLFEQTSIRPWKCILLHGPPGTGKTMISRAMGFESSSLATFFNVSASSVTSKWRGDSEKLIRVLFDVAKHFAPSIVFIDEVDSLMSLRDVNVEHEASKRFKNELLTQIDSLEDVRDVFLLASTNLPWDIDAAFLRRFERKLLLGLPDSSIRLAMICESIPAAAQWPADVLLQLAELSEGFSGDELRIAIKEATLNRIRSAIRLTDNSHSDPSAHLKQISPNDLKTAISQIKPSSVKLLAKHVVWNSQHNNHGTVSLATNSK